MGQVRDTVEQLYETGALLGFAISDSNGEMIHNESFFSDEAASRTIATLMGCADQLAASGRSIKRLTVELDDVIVIYTPITDRDRRGVFILPRSGNLDESAEKITQLAA
jgi:hypothetical protein